MFPRIQRPCPYADRLASVMDGDFCRMCKRNVVDLDALDTAARTAFLASCEEQEACVSYRIPRAAVAAALAVSALAAPMAAAAADVPTSEMSADDMILEVGGIGLNRPLTDVPIAVSVISLEDLEAAAEDPWPRKGPRAWLQKKPAEKPAPAPKAPPAKKDGKPS